AVKTLSARFKAARREEKEFQREVRKELWVEQARDEYNRYMRTDEWRAKREKVLTRANGTCEGCGERVATEVHHLTYERLGAEMLFDLVAVCSDCHMTIHQPPPSNRSTRV